MNGFTLILMSVCENHLKFILTDLASHYLHKTKPFTCKVFFFKSVGTVKTRRTVSCISMHPLEHLPHFIMLQTGTKIDLNGIMSRIHTILIPIT